MCVGRGERAKFCFWTRGRFVKIDKKRKKIRDRGIKNYRFLAKRLVFCLVFVCTFCYDYCVICIHCIVEAKKNRRKLSDNLLVNCRQMGKKTPKNGFNGFLDVSF